MTVGTNALLTERGARTALVATEGFTDLLDIARQDRPSLYRLCAARPRALVADELRFGAKERVSASGVVEALSEDEIQRIADAVSASGAEAVAVCLLFAHLDETHERDWPARSASALGACTSPPRTRSCRGSASTSDARRR